MQKPWIKAYMGNKSTEGLRPAHEHEAGQTRLLSPAQTSHICFRFDGEPSRALSRDGCRCWPYYSRSSHLCPCSWCQSRYPMVWGSSSLIVLGPNDCGRICLCSGYAETREILVLFNPRHRRHVESKQNDFELIHCWFSGRKSQPMYHQQLQKSFRKTWNEIAKGMRDSLLGLNLFRFMLGEKQSISLLRNKWTKERVSRLLERKTRKPKRPLR